MNILKSIRAAGHLVGQATLTPLGDTQHDAGDPDSAGKSWQRALAILDDLAHPDAGAVRAKLQHPAR